MYKPTPPGASGEIPSYHQESFHVVSEPAILYLGTPVVLITTENEDGSSNISPMSSAWWLGWGCMLGLLGSSKTTENLRRTGECVLNAASIDVAPAVDRLALTTGSNPVPQNKIEMGVQFIPDKFGHAGLTATKSDIVKPPRIMECPVQMEGKVHNEYQYGADNPRVRTQLVTFEICIERIHVDGRILVDGNPNRIDPDKWRPLIMNFREFYGLGEKIQPSRLSEFPEYFYKHPKFRAKDL
jgi:flavin reductase (DIM6/NTAB) family NADH-FMN oxidoreductase RutF